MANIIQWDNEVWAIAQIVNGEGRYTDYVRVSSLWTTKEAAEAAFDPETDRFLAPVKGEAGCNLVLSLDGGVLQPAEHFYPVGGDWPRQGMDS